MIPRRRRSSSALVPLKRQWLTGSEGTQAAQGKKAGFALAAQASDAIVLNAATDADREAKENALCNARLGYMDSVGGLVAGSLDSLRVAGEAMNLQRGAAAGNLALTSIHALKFGAQMTGVFGGALNAYASYLKAEDAFNEEIWSVMWLQAVATASFGGTGVTSLVGASLVGAEYLVAEKIGSKAVQQVAGRFVAARVGGMAVGAMVPVAGWVLLGVGIVGTVGAAVLEPTKLEAWARKTPFGSGPGGQKFKTLEEQNKALNEALEIASQSEPTQAKAA